MGLHSLRGTDTLAWIETCTPARNEIRTIQVFQECKVETKKSNMSTLGTMCDYGVRSHFKMRDFAYLELGMIMSGIDEILDTILTQFDITAEEAYYMCYYRELKEPVAMSSDIINDYDNLVHRAIELFLCFNLRNPIFGRYYTVPGIVKSFECDCVDERMILDMKISANPVGIKKYWPQVLLYSLLAKLVDGVTRNTIGLVLPVQGEIRWFTYPKDQYYGLFKEFKVRYGGE